MQPLPAYIFFPCPLCWHVSCAMFLSTHHRDLLWCPLLFGKGMLNAQLFIVTFKGSWMPGAAGAHYGILHPKMHV